MFHKRKKFDEVGHPECFHNWIHNAGEQCDWDMNSYGILGTKLDADSNNICNFYICTICQGEFWSQQKEFDIPHYRVKLGGLINENTNTYIT